jgi:hypothetical protein
VPVGFDPVRQAGENSIREQFAPALEIERGLSFGGMEVDRQRHWENFILLIRARQDCGPGAHDTIFGSEPVRRSHYGGPCSGRSEWCATRTSGV